MTPEEMAETLAMVLTGEMGLSLKDMKWATEPMDSLPEFYVRNTSGEVFRLVCERVTADEFSPFEDD